MQEMLGGMSVQEMVGGLSRQELQHMPPFPFPEKLFPPGTFPAGMRFSSDFNLPPQVRLTLYKSNSVLRGLRRLGHAVLWLDANRTKRDAGRR
jgi:hypothetical protein